MATTALGPLFLAVCIGLVAELAFPAGRSTIPDRPDNRTIVHVLNRIGFGAAAGDIERIRHLGLARYIDQQLEPEKIADTSLAARLAGFATLRQTSRDLAADYFLPAAMARRNAKRSSDTGGATTPGSVSGAMRGPELRRAMMQQREVLGELAEQKIVRAVYSDRQLQEVLVDFWFNHFNVFAGKGATRLYVTEYERDTIRPRILGRFRDLLGATAESPAMLFYLDNWQSAAPGAARHAGQRRARRGSSRDAAAVRSRGINENYARELMELHTLGVDGGYTQKDVEEVARAFTGWTISTPRLGGGFRFEPRMHDYGEKIVLGHRIPAGGGRSDGERVLDILTAHPSTSRFIALKLARRFVSDDPPHELVERAAARFRASRGDLRAVVRVILTSPEFLAPPAYRAKVKNPFEFVTSAIRAAGLDAPDAGPLARAIRDLGMPLYFCQPPTGYADTAQAWINAGALLNRMNFAVSLVGPTQRRLGIAAAPERTSTGGALRESIEREALAGDVSSSTASTVARAGTDAQAVALLLGSPEFQRK
jgi:uncharacterized protein (DUF1800 family)